jgi:hypothetical protein
MTTLQQQIAEKFLPALAKDQNFDAAKVEALRRLLAEGKKPKTDDLVEVLPTPRLQPRRVAHRHGVRRQHSLGARRTGEP